MIIVTMPTYGKNLVRKIKLYYEKNKSHEAKMPLVS